MLTCSVFGQLNFPVGKSEVIPTYRFQKLAPDILLKLKQRSIHQKSLLTLMISVNDLNTLKSTYANDQSFKINAQDIASGAVCVKVDGLWLNKALLDSNIQFIATARKPFPERELTGFDLSVNKINLVHKFWPNINGNGSTVSIKEELMDTLDIDFKGRYVASSLASNNLQTHATTMATIAAGGGNSFYTGKGVAWGAKITNSNFNNLLPDNLNVLKQLNVTVQNHSYGVGIENYYGADAQAYDVQMNQDSTLLHVFSAGNFGNQTSNIGNYAGIKGFANLTGSFKMSKNSITVGATDLLNNPISVSSRGPAYDGRVKPEVVALGEDGSSGSAAIVSGLSLILQEAWMNKQNTQLRPSSALLRAILINSADDVGKPHIDYISGYGAVNAFKALKTIDESRIIQGSVTVNQTKTHNILVPNNAVNLKITIAWLDPASTINASSALINDLDLEVTHLPSLTKYAPWILNSQPNLAALESEANRGRDSLNNVEQITIDLPASGNYQLAVKGTKLGSLGQTYSIVWQYDTISHFQFTFPVKGNQLISNIKQQIKWETNISGSATLQFSFKGNNWETISNQISLKDGRYEWLCPNELGLIQLRMLIGSNFAYTDTIALAPIISAKTGFNCIDSFLLFWPKIGVSQYQVSTLGLQYMEPYIITADTILIKEKLNNPYQVFTVAPIISTHFNTLSGYAIDYTQQANGCYINGFFADPIDSSRSRLTLQLGSTYQVGKVVFEKLNAKGYNVIRTISPVSSFQINSIELTNPGLNIFRAKVELLNGQYYYTTPVQVLNFTEKPYYLFPNPVVSGMQLKLMSNDIDSTVFQLYDISGKRIHVQLISSYIEPIQVPVLPKGVYYAIILRAGIVQKRWPLIIL